MRFIVYSAPNLVPWGPEASGGSEGFHIELVNRLARLGHEVISYSPMASKETVVVGGVPWGHCDDADVGLEGVWIIQRSPDFAYRFPDPHPNQILLFSAHDIDYEQAKDLPPWIWLYDAVLAETEVHASFLCMVHKWDNIVVTGNGVPVEKLVDIPLTNRNPKSIFHACNPTRGLLPLLTIFRRVHMEDPGITLRVAFGMEFLDSLLQCGKDSDGMLKRLRSKLLTELNQPGVEWLGRLPSSYDVWCEYAKAGMFVYPTLFSEIFAASVVEAQMMGAIPIVSPTMALAETTRHGIKIAGDVEQDRMVQARFVREILGLVNNPPLQEKIRDEMIPDVRATYNFQDMVERIVALAVRIQEKHANPVPFETNPLPPAKHPSEVFAC